MNLYGITRFDYRRTHGWFVRFERKAGTVRKLFSDRVYGSRAESLTQALKFRDACIKTIGVSSANKVTPGNLKKAVIARRNRSGEWHYYPVWTAWIRIAPGRLVSSKWSIDKWGHKIAKKKALAWLETKRLIQERNYRKLRCPV